MKIKKNVTLFVLVGAFKPFNKTLTVFALLNYQPLPYRGSPNQLNNITHQIIG